MTVPINNCLTIILVWLGFLTLGWLPLWAYKHYQRHRQEMPNIFLKNLGLLILAACVVIAFYQITTWAIIRYQLEDREVIDVRYGDFQEAIADKRHEDAYLYMSPEYRENNSLNDFQTWVNRYYFPKEDPDRYIRISLFSNTAILMPEYSVYGDIWQNTVKIYWIKIDRAWYLTGDIELILD